MLGIGHSKHIFDIAVIGAGVVGAAIARKLTEYELSVVLIDSAADVGSRTSRANTAILHTGFDAPKSSLEAKLVTRGYSLLRSFADETGISYEKTGALLIAWSPEELTRLPEIKEKAKTNGVCDIHHVNSAELYAMEPNLGTGALGALEITGESIICPFSPVIAFATEAAQNGATLRLGCRVTSARRISDVTMLKLADQLGRPAELPGELLARWVVNAAGLYSDEIDRMFGFSRFTVRPRKGELIVFDKMARSLLSHILLPVPNPITKGVLIAPTVFGNVLLGPTATDIDDKTDWATTVEGISGLLQKGKKLMPSLLEEDVTALYAGLRAATEHSDYQIHLEKKEQYVCVGGIRSTGLSASMGISEFVVENMQDHGLMLVPKKQFTSVKMPPIGYKQTRPSMSEKLLARNPDYGRMVCHCEKVSQAEITSALTSSVPAVSLDGLKRRTRALSGRCQGFYCMANVASLLEKEGIRCDHM